MAVIGLKNPVAATYTEAISTGYPTYDGNGGMVAGKAISANITINRNNSPLYADDTLAENDNTITSMGIEFTLDDLDPVFAAYALGYNTVTTGTPAATDYYETTGDSAPYVGFGYVRSKQKNGVIKYEGVWYYKVQFGISNETTNTKGENTEWQTPVITGTVFGTKTDSSGKIKFRKIKPFDTEAAAISWVDALANISVPNP